MLFILIASTVLGLVIGSFANVVILRWGTGKSLRGRSSCAVCGHPLSWFELVPVASHVLQRGRCRRCGSKISPHYALVELTFGALFALSAYFILSPAPALCSSSLLSFVSLYPCILVSSTLLYAWASIFLLVSIAAYDIRHFIIPDGLVYAYIILSFAWGVFSRGPSLQGMTEVLGSGVIVALPLFLLWALSKGRWMGFGDIKLSIGMGFMLGTLGGISALTFGVWLGAIVSLLLIVFQRIARKAARFAPHGKRFTIKSEIPFGPFLVAGTLFVFLTDITLFHIIRMM